MLGRIRLLPVLMVAAGLLFTVKVGGVYTTIDEGLRADVRVSVAQPAIAQDTSGTTGSGTDNQTAAAPADPESDQPLDPLLFSRTEIEILQDLRARRKELDEREQALDQREGILLAAESRLDERLMELKSVQAEIEDLINTYNQQQDQELVQLVSIYEKMKAKEAAAIFNQLDLPILLDVIQGMKESKSAPILARMQPARAREVTTELARREAMPALDGIDAQTQ